MRDKMLKILILLYIVSCSSVFEYEKRIANPGTSLAIVSSKLMNPITRVNHLNEEYWFYSTGYIFFKNQKVFASGPYQIKSRHALNTLGNKPLHEMLPLMGSPTQIIEGTDKSLVFRYSNAALVYRVNKPIILIEAPLVINEVEQFSITAFSDETENQNKKYIILPGNKDLNEEDLQFKEVKNYLESVLKLRKRLIVNKINEANYALLVNYGISDPKEDVEIVSRPIFIPSFIAGQTTNIAGAMGNKIGSFQTNDRWSSQLAQITETKKKVTFNRWINIETMDMDFYRQKKVQKPVWKTIINSTGPGSDLRIILPVLVYLSGEFINIDTQSEKLMSLKGTEINRIFLDQKLKKFLVENKKQAICFNDSDCSRKNICMKKNGDEFGECENLEAQTQCNKNDDCKWGEICTTNVPQRCINKPSEN